MRRGADSHTLVVRFNGDGSLDTTFDGDGSKVIPVSPAGRDYAQAVALQDMGSGQPQKIVLGGGRGSRMSPAPRTSR